MFDQRQLRALRRTPPGPTGNRVRTAIELSGKTQREIAAALDMSEPHLSDIARGRFNTIRMDTAQGFARYFGCSVDDLFPIPVEVRAS